MIQAGEAILEVGDPSALEVVIDVLSFDATKLKPGNLVFLEHSRYPIPPTALHLLFRAGPVWILAFALHNAAVTQPQAPQLGR